MNCIAIENPGHIVEDVGHYPKGKDISQYDILLSNNKHIRINAMYITEDDQYKHYLSSSGHHHKIKKTEIIKIETRQKNTNDYFETFQPWRVE